MEQWEKITVSENVSQKCFWNGGFSALAVLLRPWLWGRGLVKDTRTPPFPNKTLSRWAPGQQCFFFFKSSKVIPICSHRWKPHLRLRILLGSERGNWGKKFAMAKTGFRTGRLVAGGTQGLPGPRQALSTAGPGSSLPGVRRRDAFTS